jgi:hypothetical protein
MIGAARAPPLCACIACYVETFTLNVFMVGIRYVGPFPLPWDGTLTSLVV